MKKFMSILILTLMYMSISISSCFAKTVKLTLHRFLLRRCKLQEYSPPSRTVGSGVFTPFVTNPNGSTGFAHFSAHFEKIFTP